MSELRDKTVKFDLDNFSPQVIEFWLELEGIWDSEALNENAKIVLTDYYASNLKKNRGIK